MAIKLVRSASSVQDPAVVNMPCSGTVHPNSVVEFSRTGNAGVNIADAGSTNTEIFGVCLDYAEGKSDTFVRVIPFAPGQLWECDCTASAITAQIGLRHVLNAGALAVRNTSTDTTATPGIFRCIAINTTAGGSGKVIGEFSRNYASFDPGIA